MAEFELLKTDYVDDILNESINQVRKYIIVNNIDGSISLTDVTSYLKTGTFIGAKDINSMCTNMNTIMGYLEATDGNIAEEFNIYFKKQKELFEKKTDSENDGFMKQFEALLENFKKTSSSEFNAWFSANSAKWSQEVYDRMDDIVIALESFSDDNGRYNSQRMYKRYSVVTYEHNNERRAYIAINQVPAGISPPDTNYWAAITLKGDDGIGLIPKGEWSSGVIYKPDNLVSYKNCLWCSTTINQNATPSRVSSDWYMVFELINEANNIKDEITYRNYEVTMINGVPYMKEVQVASGTMSAIVDEVTGVIYKMTMINEKPYLREVG